MLNYFTPCAVRRVCILAPSLISMVTGLGIDIIEIERVQHNIGKEAGFKEMIFSQNEIDYCESKANKFQHYAARFAAKEAFLKALGTGWMEGIQFNEIEIINNGNGAPELIISGGTQITLSSFAISKVLVSLSHLKTLATAVVVIEK